MITLLKIIFYDRISKGKRYSIPFELSFSKRKSAYNNSVFGKMLLKTKLFIVLKKC